MLMSVEEFRQQFTQDSRPDPRTVRSWIQKGQVFGQRIGRRWYVDPDREPAPEGQSPASLSDRARRVLSS